MTSATAFAPGGIGNIGPGLDILGCAVSGAGDTVTATLAPGRGVTIEDPGHPSLPRTAEAHAAGLAALEVLRRAGAGDVGLALRVAKGLPLSGGQGGSAASAVAGAVAANSVLGEPLGGDALLAAALVAEERLSGRHLDNVAPALLGGIVLVRDVDALDLVRLPVPPQLRIVLAQPAQELPTARARAVLPRNVPLEVAVRQAANVAAMVAALASGDLALLGRAVDDRIAEAPRATLLPGFAEAKHAAMGAGALAASISGAGPTSFALVEGDTVAPRVAEAMVAAYARMGMAAVARVARVDERGARLVGEPELVP